MLEYVAGYSGGLYVVTGTRQTDWDDSPMTSIVQKILGAPYQDSLIYSPFPVANYNLTRWALDPLTVPMAAEATVNVTLTITTELFTGIDMDSMNLDFYDQKDNTKYLGLQYAPKDMEVSFGLVPEF